MKRTLLATSLVAGALALATQASADENAFQFSASYSIGQVLLPGNSLVGNSCYHHTDLRLSDGNLVTYAGPGEGSPFYDFPMSGVYGDFAIMQGDGNFVVYNGGQAVYNTNTEGNPGDHAVQQDDGNFVVYASNGNALKGTRSTSYQPVVSPCSMTSTVWDVSTGEAVVGAELGSYGGTGQLPGGWAKCGESCNALSNCVAFNYFYGSGEYTCDYYSQIFAGPEGEANTIVGIKKVLTPSR